MSLKFPLKPATQKEMKIIFSYFLLVNLTSSLEAGWDASPHRIPRPGLTL